jgi:ABC-2 type transport system permease protein
VGAADYTTPEGYLTAEFVSWVPIVTLIFAIMAGTSALAGEETNGTLDVLMSQPISRRRLAVEKVAGIVVATVAIALISCLGWLASVPFVDIEINMGDLILATMNLAPITLAFAFLSMWAGVGLPDRRVATGTVTAIAVAAFFVNYLAELVDALQPIAWVSLFHYYDLNILTTGIDWWRSSVLVVAAFLFAAGAIYSFEQREIGVRSGFRLRLLRPKSA